jgi:D-alanyl-D-alanine carboxypeptidase/D-alanyl-D-alanine-endopeptidase (penicillin-binding protein 4)
VGGLNFDQNCIDFVIQPTAPGTRVSFSLEPNSRYVNVENLCVTGQNEVLLGRKPGTNEIVLKGQAPHGNPSVFSETIHDPPVYGATVLAETLENSGVQVAGTVKRDCTMRQQRAKGPAGEWTVVAIHETPLSLALARANKDSVNLYAESLCKRLGHEATQQSGSWENGTAAVGAFLKKAGVAENEFKLDDGSGLSKQNAVSAHALVRVLAYDFYGKNRDAFVNSLSISGVDGTLEERFRGSDLRKRVIGKSGFVEGVSCLSGLLKARDGEWYAFAIMMNGVPHGGTSIAKALQERIVKAVDTHSLVAAARG